MENDVITISKGRQIDLLVLYCDLVGSTRTVMSLEPRQVKRFYKIFLDEMTHVIDDFGGHILKFVGDCIIGLFIMPNVGWIPYVDSAILCAEMMQNVMKHSISPTVESEGLPPMRCRIALDYGEVQVVEVGVEDIYMSVDVFGNVMNVTSKILSKAEPEEVLIGRNMWDLLYTTHRTRCKKTETLEIDGNPYEIYMLTY